MKKKMKFGMPYVIQWKSQSGWETTACFSEREDAMDYMASQAEKFPEDEFRIERFKVFVGDEEANPRA